MLDAYREHYHLSERQALDDPWEAVERFIYRSSLIRERDNLEAKRQDFQSRE